MSETNQSGIKTPDINSILKDTYSFVNNIITNPTVLIILAITILSYIVLKMFLGSSSSNTNGFTDINGNPSSGTSRIITIVIVIFVILFLLNAVQYLFRVDVIKTIKDIISGDKPLEIIKDIQDLTRVSTNKPIDDSSTSRVAAVKAPVPELLLRKQVFNIPQNSYVYDDAKALCSAYGARLATYQEVETAYNDGGDWCNYGWSSDQMALFPTQQKKYDALQKIKGHENDCGRPGVNGGFIEDPNSRFGVNCYGYKPRMTPEEEDIMSTQPLYPKTEKDIALEQRVKFWKDKLKNILVSPFNHNTWSRM